MAKRFEYLYTVDGRGTFPIDMLRYDRATPNTEGDSALIESTFRRGAGGGMVVVRSEKAPTVARWASFGWKCGPVTKRAAA